MQPTVLFCADPFEPNKVDPDFEEELMAARKQGFSTLLFNYEDLTNPERAEQACKRIKVTDVLTPIIYRGWMLTPKQYSFLYEELLSKNYKLINTPAEYQNCHYLPDSLRFIETHTPKTVYERFSDEHSIARLKEKAQVFGNKAVIIKDYVKSEKHDWETACFVPDASDAVRLESTIRNLIRLRDKYLNEGIVVREFVELNDLTIHSKSGMPLAEEYRLSESVKRLLYTICKKYGDWPCNN
ncbi:MAG: hypothetical protein K0S33_3866 [Bacteroidetes bacterium]|jgi:hypothetical protein|nr:hypothetical protein [Bacteroidota bacterium]